jgi:predicted CoA-binding protein
MMGADDEGAGMAEAMMDAARKFLASKRIALVGVSRSDKDMSRVVMRELLARGCDVVPVSPFLSDAEGRRCFRRVQDIEPPAEAALLMTPRTQTDVVVRDCVEAGVKTVWMHRGAGAGCATGTAVETCEKNGIGVITDLCPFMALPGASWLHRLHGFFRRRALRP